MWRQIQNISVYRYRVGERWVVGCISVDFNEDSGFVWAREIAYTFKWPRSLYSQTKRAHIQGSICAVCVRDGLQGIYIHMHLRMHQCEAKLILIFMCSSFTRNLCECVWVFVFYIHNLKWVCVCVCVLWKLCSDAYHERWTPLYGSCPSFWNGHRALLGRTKFPLALHKTNT